MAINKKLIHFQTLTNFEIQLSAGNILDTSICFIKDAKKIWTHGQFYDCNENLSIIEITYNELVNLRNSSALIPGCWYRITDYITTTFTSNTKSAGHQFDIIVLAISENTLSEEARACKREFNIENFKDAYSHSWGENMIYIGTYEYNGKMYHYYQTVNEEDNVQMLVDFDDIRLIYLSDEIYQFIFWPTYAKFTHDEFWEAGEAFGENISFKSNPVNYFKNSNLDAWKIWYCLDNDEDKFEWITLSNLYMPQLITIRTDDDGNTAQDDEPYKATDIFISYDYLGNNNGEIVPVLYKTDIYGDEQAIPDYEDIFFYEGIETIDGEEYDKWRKIDYNHFEWDSINKYYALTQRIVYDNKIVVTGSQGDIRKGVIYRMIDEFNNDCPYDFKNILFKRGITENGLLDEENYWAHEYLYTFSWIDLDGEFGMYDGIYDFSIKGNNGDLRTDEGLIEGCYNNVIKPCTSYYSVDNLKYILNNNVFLSNGPTTEVFGTYNNILNINCYDNSFGDGCHNNSFGDSCYFNSFGHSCYNNSFGHSCYNNSFGNYCASNSFGNYCDSNSFGNYCDSNSFGNYCDSNSFGNYCQNNSFGDDCYGNSFGDVCFSNSFGNNCYSNSFRMDNLIDGDLRAYCSNNIFENSVSYVTLYNTSTASSSNVLQNVRVCQGMSGPSNTYNRVKIPELNAQYQIKVAKNTKGEVKVYCEADLIQ